MAAATQQQQQQSNMRRAASAFAGSHELAAAAAEMGGGSSSSGPELMGHHSEPSVSQQGSGIPTQPNSSSGMPPPAPYAGAAHTGESRAALCMTSIHVVRLLSCLLISYAAPAFGAHLQRARMAKSWLLLAYCVPGLAAAPFVAMPPPPSSYVCSPYVLGDCAGLSGGSLAVAGASSGGSSYCLSPPSTSPPMSRESSSQGPLSSLATPEALQLRGKSKGRFQVCRRTLGLAASLLKTIMA
jgi:hypothetical protein